MTTKNLISDICKNSGNTSHSMLLISTEKIFTARCYASAVLAMGLCPCLCLCLSQAGVVLKRQNVGSHK